MSEGQAVAATDGTEVKMTITESAQDYLAELLSKQGDDVLGVRVFITQPGTPKAETCIAYCREGDAQDDDIQIPYPKLTIYVETRSVPFLEDATVDYAKDRMGGQLTIKAPNSRLPRVNENSPLEDRINYILYNEVNPSLAARLRPAACRRSSISSIAHSGSEDLQISRKPPRSVTSMACRSSRYDFFRYPSRPRTAWSPRLVAWRRSP